MPETLRVSHMYSISTGMHLGLISNIFLRLTRAHENVIQTYRILLSPSALSCGKRDSIF